MFWFTGQLLSSCRSGSTCETLCMWLHTPLSSGMWLLKTQRSLHCQCISSLNARVFPHLLLRSDSGPKEAHVTFCHLTLPSEDGLLPPSP